MTTAAVEKPEVGVRVPEWVRDLASFRRWARSADFPERGWYSFLDGGLWVEPNMERLAHNKVKSKISAVLTLLTEQEQVGTYLNDRMLLTNLTAGLSTEPDGMFFSYDAERSGRVKLEHGEDSIEVIGSPEMVLEVISRSSVQKDTAVLRNLYWRAGVKEYWLADPREEDVVFDILRHGPKGYGVARKQAGWVRSSVFGKSFRLSRQNDPLGHPTYRFAVR